MGPKEIFALLTSNSVLSCRHSSVFAAEQTHSPFCMQWQPYLKTTTTKKTPRKPNCWLCIWVRDEPCSVNWDEICIDCWRHDLKLLESQATVSHALLFSGFPIQRHWRNARLRYIIHSVGNEYCLLAWDCLKSKSLSLHINIKVAPMQYEIRRWSKIVLGEVFIHVFKRYCWSSCNCNYNYMNILWTEKHI